MSRMDWRKLLSTRRVSSFSDSCEKEPDRPSAFSDGRNAYERDADQIIYSSQFRRLQDKTQVIPFPEFDFVHTRLTHTLEVAAVGRSLGKMAGDYVCKNESALAEQGVESSHFSDILQAACLAHDIGNPPFGHSGEDAISHFLRTQVSPTFDKRFADLTNFEGNANGLRILLNCRNKGINPTCAMVGAFSKYPRESKLQNDPPKRLRKRGPKSQSKYGFFQTERDTFAKVAEELGLLRLSNIDDADLSWKRHPLAFLMEAADDICYRMIDFEDGLRLKIINYWEPYHFNLSGYQEFTSTPKDLLIEIAKIDPNFHLDHEKYRNDFKGEITFLRSKVINVLTHLSFGVFERNYEGIMCGEYDKSLIEDIDTSVFKSLAAIEELIRKYVYEFPPVLESEAAGFKVIAGLLNAFAVTASICTSCGEEKDEEQKKLEKLLPQKYRPEPEEESGNLTFPTIYERYLKIIDYVSGMTDGFAISLYRKIMGISLPNI